VQEHFFYLNQVLRNDIDKKSQIFSIIFCLLFFVGFFVILLFLSTNGNFFIEIDKSLPKNNQIFVNLSCTNGSNCSGIIPNDLQITCPAQNCPQIPSVCQTPEQVRMPISHQDYKCDWYLQLPC